MAIKTTIKVALLTGAAKDDFFSADASGLTEDLLLAALNVLGNDPGSAHLYSLQQNLSGTAQMTLVKTAFSALGAMITINPDGTIAYDASNIGESLSHLAEGQLATDTFVYTVRMANGALSTAQVTLQIAGENDPPTLDSILPVVIHDTSIDDTPDPVPGQLSGHDVDNGAQLTYSMVDPTSIDAVNHVQTKQMEYGTLTLHTDTGNYTFFVDPDKIDALPLGSNPLVVFTVKVTDEHGASSDARDITFNLIGANDTAVIAGTATGSVTEDGNLTAGGSLSVSDRDLGAVGFAPVANLQGTYGDFTFNANGDWSYLLRNDDANVQGLALNQHVNDTLMVTSQDGTATEVITVTVNGVNDPARIFNSFEGKVFEDGTLTTGSTVGVIDIDDDPAMPKLQSVSASALHGTFGNFTFNNATGVWTYTLRNSDANVQALGASGNGNDVLTVTSQDGTASEDITVLVLGANDPATITGIRTGNVTEDGTLTASDTLGVADIDDNPAFPIFQSVNATALHGVYGDFTFNISSGVWGYTLRNADVNVQALSVTDHPTDALTVISQDGTSTRTITVTVNGANDPATIVGTHTGNVTEDGTLSASGTLNVTDPDDNPANPAFQSANAAALHGTYGDFTFNQSSGAWSYALRNGDANVQALAATDHPTESLIVTSQDGTATQTITVTVNGANDAPTLDTPTVLTFTDTVAGDPSTTQSGTLAGHDIDSSTLHYSFSSLAGVTISGNDQVMSIGGDTLTLHTLTGGYSYRITSNNLNKVGEGIVKTTSFGVQAIDDQNAHSATQNIVINVNGVDDIATITGTLTGSVTEDGSLRANGTAHVTDPDTIAVNPPFQSVSAGLTGTYGNFTFDNSTGAWTYLLRNSDANVQALTSLQHPTDTLTVISQDGKATETITVTVNGADEPLPNTDPTPALDFFVTPLNFDEFGHYDILNFTANDKILFGPGFTVLFQQTVDLIADSGHMPDSTVFDVSYLKGGILTPGVVELVGFLNPNPDQIIHL